jgi:electron transport complex protein RnfC
MPGTFSGGIHPPEKKGITEEVEFSNLSIPTVCYLPVQQHIGKPARPLVEVGDTVEEGQLVAESDGFISANVHAPVSGKVTEIAEHPGIYPVQTTIVIESEGSFSSSHPVVNADIDFLSKEDIISRIRSAGIVGLGGAAFPTAVKLSPPEGKTVDLLIINGAECEPYLTVDDVLMRTCPDEIIEGIRITLRALGVDRAVIGIENNKPKAVSILAGAVEKAGLSETITVQGVKTKYPQGAEKQLIYTLTGRRVPAGGLPMDVGIVVQNVGTIYAIREAVMLEKPLYERYVTVSGSMIARPGNYKVRLGTRISDIIEECGGLTGDPAKVVIGGPMCGLSVPTMDIPVVKGTSGILFLSEKDVNLEDYTDCIRCGKCVQVCPMGMVPCDIGAAVENERMDIAEELNPYDCIMCGSCTYTCPAKRPLSHFIKLAQQRLKSKRG